MYVLGCYLEAFSITSNVSFRFLFQTTLTQQVITIVNNFHPDKDGTGQILVQGLKKKQPNWFNNTDHKSVDVQQIIAAFKDALSSNALIKASGSRIAILSLAIDALSSFTQAELIIMLGVTETDIRNASRYVLASCIQFEIVEHFSAALCIFYHYTLKENKTDCLILHHIISYYFF